MSKKFYLLVIMVLMLITIKAQADFKVKPDGNGGFFPEYIPPACRKPDRENYDDLYCAHEMGKLDKALANEELPDEQRNKHQFIGGSILVEKKTGLRAGLYKIQIEGDPNPSSGFIIGTDKHALMFAVGDYVTCDVDNDIEIIKNTSEFTLFYWSCGYKSHGKEILIYNYINYDKHYQRLDMIFQAAGYVNSVIVGEPKLNLVKGQYQFRWPDFQHPDGDKANIYYDFKFTGSDFEDYKCMRSWNDDCTLYPQDPPIPPGKYKILEEDPPND